jgi:aminopeptidase N
LAAEKVSGRDLNWFFNQWFLDSGHPNLQIETNYHNDSLALSITQTQDLETAPIYRLPIDIEIWHSEESISKTVILENKQQVFEFKSDFEPDLVVIDPDNSLLADIDFDQDRDELIHQYRVSDRALTRMKALENLLKDSVDEEVIAVFLEAIEDPFWAIRQLTVNAFEGYPDPQPEQLVSRLRTIARSDDKSLVRADAITVLSSFENDQVHLPLYMQALEDSSYAVAGAGLTAYLQTEHPDRDDIALKFEEESNIQLVIPLADYYALDHVPGKYSWYQQQLEKGSGEMMFYMVNYFGQYLSGSDSQEQLAGAKLLEDLGLNHNMYYIRYSAFQALGLLDGIEEIYQMRKRVRESETDPRLLEVYSQQP